MVPVMPLVTRARKKIDGDNVINTFDWNLMTNSDFLVKFNCFDFIKLHCININLELDSGSIGSSPVPSYRRLINILVTSKDEVPHFVFEITALKML